MSGKCLCKTHLLHTNDQYQLKFSEAIITESHITDCLLVEGQKMLLEGSSENVVIYSAHSHLLFVATVVVLP